MKKYLNISFIISAFLFCVGSFILFKQIIFLNNVYQTSGKIVGLSRCTTCTSLESRQARYPRVEFIDSKGNILQFTSNLSQIAQQDIGKIVNIYYNPDFPQEAQIKNLFNQFFPIVVLFGLGFIFLLSFLSTNYKGETNSNFEEIKAESIFGSLSAFPLLQIFGFIIYQGFISNKPIFLLFNGFILVGFLFFQSSAINKIRVLLSEHSFSQMLKPGLKDIFLTFLGVIFIIIWISFLSGYYPFPRNASTNYAGVIVYYLISWIISWILSSQSRWKNIRIQERVTTKNRFLVMIILILFFLVSLLAPPGSFYLFSIIPLGAFIVVLSSWMMEK